MDLKLFYILVLAAVVRVAVYLLMNVIFYGYDTFGHPDSYLYHYITLAIREQWLNGNIVLSRYPEYVNITALLYFLPGPDRLGPEILNIIVSVATIFILYLTVLKVTKKKAIANIAALVLALDPYIVYLSTQYLKDTLLIFATSLLLYGITTKTIRNSFLGMLLVSFFRSVQAITFIPLILFLNPTKRAALICLPLAILFLANSFLAYGIDLTKEVPTPPNANTTGESHIQFFYPPSENVIEYKNPHKFLGKIVNPLTYLEAVRNFLLFPNILKARTPIEIGFAGYMIYWYCVLTLGVIGITSKPKIPRELLVLAVWGLILGTLLAATTSLQGPLVRWRLQLFYFLIPALSIGIYSLKDYEVRKRFLDILFASTFIILLLPVYSIIALTLKLTQGRVVFKQKRVGYKGQRFTIYKFVSMKPNSDGRTLVDGYDTRVTKFGSILRKTTLDEIPSLLNVLKGDMSVVGPRPLAEWEHNTCEKMIQNWNKRYRVKPGMIGLAQLKTDRRDNFTKLKYDLYYTIKKSHWLDLLIFFKGLTYNITGQWR